MLLGRFFLFHHYTSKDLPDHEPSYYYELGIGVKPDVEEAKRWYMRASGMSLPTLIFCVFMND